jgi:transposase
MPAPASGRWLCSTSPSTAAPPRWPGAADAIPKPLWVGCTPITPRVLTLSSFTAPAVAPLCAQIQAGLGEVVHAAQRRAAAPPVDGADPAPRFTLKRLVAFVRERFGRLCCRETIRAALHRLTLSWKKAKTLLGRANPERRQAFVEQLQGVLDGAQRDRHLLVYIDEAHIHQDADLGYGWAERGRRLWVASHSPGLSARVSFYGLYLDNEGQVRLWPYRRANGEHTIAVLRRLRAAFPDEALIVLWDGAPYHRAQAVREVARTRDIELMPLPGYSPDLMPVEALWRWLREDVTYHHCHASAADLTRRAADFETRLNRDPFVIADRLWVKDHLDPEEEKLRFSN